MASVTRGAEAISRVGLALGVAAAAAVGFAVVGRGLGAQPLVLAGLGAAVAGFLALVAVYHQLRPVMDWAVRVTVVWVPLANGLSDYAGPAREVVRNLDAALTLFGLGLLALHFVEQRRIPLPWTPVTVPLALLLVVDAVSLVANHVPPVIGLAGIRATLQYATLYYVIVYLNPEPRQQRRYLALSFATCAGICGLTLLQLLRDKFLLHVDSAPYATLGDRSALGLYLQFHLVVLAVLLIRRVDVWAGWPRLQWGRLWQRNVALIALLGVTLLATNGRTAWVGIAAALLAVALATSRWRRWILIAGLIGALFVGFVRVSGIAQYYEDHYYRFDNGNFFDRFFLLFTDRYFADSFAGGRLYYTRVSLPVIADHPLIGVGPGRFGGWVGTTVYPSPLYAQYGIVTYYGTFDIALFPFWAENGTLGLLCLVLLWGGVARLGLRLQRRTPDPFARALGLGAYALVISTLVLAFIGPVLESHPWSAYLWLTAGLATVAYRQMRDESSPRRHGDTELS